MSQSDTYVYNQSLKPFFKKAFDSSSSSAWKENSAGGQLYSLCSVQTKFWHPHIWYRGLFQSWVSYSIIWTNGFMAGHIFKLKCIIYKNPIRRLFICSPGCILQGNTLLKIILRNLWSNVRSIYRYLNRQSYLFHRMSSDGMKNQCSFSEGGNTRKGRINLFYHRR